MAGSCPPGRGVEGRPEGQRGGENRRIKKARPGPGAPLLYPGNGCRIDVDRSGTAATNPAAAATASTTTAAAIADTLAATAAGCTSATATVSAATGGGTAPAAAIRFFDSGNGFRHPAHQRLHRSMVQPDRHRFKAIVMIASPFVARQHIQNE